MSAPESIEALEKEISKCRDLLSKIQFKGSRYFLDQTIFRYLWGAVASGDLILLAVKADHSSGTESLGRHLHESLLDLVFILSDPDPQLCAAKTVLADLNDWKEIWDLHHEMAPASDAEPVPPVPPEWDALLSKSTDEVANDLDKLSSEMGGGNDLFAQAKEELDAQGHWHWSGLSRYKMIKTLEKRDQLDDASSVKARQHIKLFNLGSHASPSWSTLNLQITGEEQVHIFADPSESDDDEIMTLASQTTSLLAGMRKVVEESGVSFKTPT